MPDENLIGIIEAEEERGVKDPKSEIAQALGSPIGSKKLSEIAGIGEKAAIVVDDTTLPAPSNLILPSIINELNNAGVKDEDITIIFGRGIHRALKSEEIPQLIGEDVTKRVKIICHNCKSPENVYIGETSLKTKVYINKTFTEADIKILTGDICLHCFAGYSGGRKSILPAIAAISTIQHNHSLLLDPQARTGNLEGNPVHLDMMEAARLANVDFVLNVVLNTEGNLVKALAGGLEEVFAEGVKFVDKMCKVPVQEQADIVITSAGGHPADVNLYKAFKAIDMVLDIVRDHGVIILVAECPEGHGNDVFYDWMMKFKSLDEMGKEIKRNFMLGGHEAYHLMKAIKKARIILVSVMPDYYVTGVFRLRTAKTINSALLSAFGMVGKRGKIWVSPRGSSTLPIIQK